MYVLFLALYIVFLLYVIIDILLHTHSTPKTLAYILMILLLPLFGAIVYLAFGSRRRHNKTIEKGKKVQQVFDSQYRDAVKNFNKAPQIEIPNQFADVVQFLNRIGGELLSSANVQLLINGEQKFPELLSTLATAKSFIHIEYYTWENDIRGNQIKEILLKKCAEGVHVRILYDDFASRKIKRNIAKELEAAGAEIYPIIRVRLVHLANRLNHRDHRKIIIMDGHTAFIGGINISDRYDNTLDTGLYWRDTHVKVTGQLVHNIQRHFIVAWNLAQQDSLTYNSTLFPVIDSNTNTETAALGQIVAGGPIYPMANIMLTYTRIFSLAREKLYITNPYFIPNDTILDALKQAALSGTDVRLLIPEKPDSAIVGASAKFYFKELLECGVRIFLYSKGFIHAKTLVADSSLCVVGTANMDIRSFELNFEIMSVLYSNEFAIQMENMFLDDLQNSKEVLLAEWNQQNIFVRLTWSIARLVSSFL